MKERKERKSVRVYERERERARERKRGRPDFLVSLFIFSLYIFSLYIFSLFIFSGWPGLAWIGLWEESVRKKRKEYMSIPAFGQQWQQPQREDEPTLDPSQGSSSCRMFVVLWLFVVTCKSRRVQWMLFVCSLVFSSFCSMIVFFFFFFCDLVWILSLFLVGTNGTIAPLGHFIHLLSAGTSAHIFADPFGMCKYVQHGRVLEVSPWRNQRFKQKCLCQCYFG